MSVLMRIGIVAVALTQAAPRNPFQGYWLGSLRNMRMLVHVDVDPNGHPRAALTSLDQSWAERVADTTTIENGELCLQFTAMGVSFRGRLDGKNKLIGEFVQRGATSRLVLERTEGPPDVRRRSQVPIKPYPYDEENVRFPNTKAAITFAGTLTLPRTPGPHPAVVLVSGSGPQDRDETVFEHKPFLVIADALTRRGIAVLRVDDRGVGGSSGSREEATSDDYTDDALAAMAFLKGRPDIDGARIGLVGHSEGGLIAPLAASRSRDVAFIVMLGGPGLPGSELLLHQTRALQLASGNPRQTVEFNVRLLARVLGIVMKNTDEATIQRQVDAALLDELAKIGKGDEATRARVQASMDLPRYRTPWMRFFLLYDPRPVLEKLTIPILAMNGEKDLQVLATENLAAIDAAFQAASNRNGRTLLLPGLNHLFQTAKTGTVTEYATIEETFAPAALAAMADWIVAHTGRR